MPDVTKRSINAKALLSAGLLAPTCLGLCLWHPEEWWWFISAALICFFGVMTLEVGRQLRADIIREIGSRHDV